MNTVTANIKVIENDKWIVFQNQYKFTDLLKKDGSPHLTNQNKMERDLKRTRDILNDQYILNSKGEFRDDRKLVCNFEIVN